MSVKPRVPVEAEVDILSKYFEVGTIAKVSFQG